MGQRKDEGGLMPKLDPPTAKADCDKARLARSILNAARRAEDLGFGDAARLLRQAQAVAEQAAEADRAVSTN